MGKSLPPIVKETDMPSGKLDQYCVEAACVITMYEKYGFIMQYNFRISKQQ